jgi:GxxExxY protein
MTAAGYKHAEVTDQIIATFYKVYNTHGWGFLEKVYQNSMEVAFQKQGIAAIP